MLKDVALGSTVTLCESEIKIATYIGNARHYYRSQVVKNNTKLRSPDGGYSVGVTGAAGELAFCKLHNVYMDLVVLKDLNVVTDYDVLYQNRKVDIKTSSRPDGNVLIPVWKSDKDIDAFVLMIGDIPTFTFRGFVTASEIFQEKRMKDFGRGMNYVASQSELKPFSFLDFSI